MIEGDIKGFFDNVNHNVLANILERHIKDQQFMDLYWKLVKAGYIDNGIKYNTYTGVPQGGIVSPIQSNIYLNEFESFMQERTERYSKKKKGLKDFFFHPNKNNFISEVLYEIILF